MNDSTSSSTPKAATKAIPFGVNAMRLNGRQWIWVLAIMLLAILGIPRIWKSIERFDTGPDYRIPYSLSQDYWLYQRWLEQSSGTSNIFVVGDSVVWGEYVLADGTLPHYLNREAGPTRKFINAGMNGLFPLALEGLVNYYGSDIQNKKVLLHCNLLWMSSPKADLQVDKEEKINHSRLVPQFYPRIPCYRVDANERLAAVVERNLSLGGWVNHIQHAYYGSKSILSWTLQDNGDDPPLYTNSYRNPLSQIHYAVPSEPVNDPARGPASSRHVSWFKGGAKPSQFEWVELKTSLQWQAFCRLADSLLSNGNDLFIVLGPFNEHMIADESREPFHKLKDGAIAWFDKKHLSYCVPETLPSELYADGSHPLTGGYELLAKQLLKNSAFQAWLKR